MIEEDPLSQIWFFVRSPVLQTLAFHEEALASNRKAVEIDPHFWMSWLQLGLDYAILGLRKRAGHHTDGVGRPGLTSDRVTRPVCESAILALMDASQSITAIGGGGAVPLADRLVVAKDSCVRSLVG